MIVGLLSLLVFLPYGSSFGIGPRKTNHRSTSCLYMGMKVNIRIVGRKSGSEPWLEDACNMYQVSILLPLLL